MRRHPRTSVLPVTNRHRRSRRAPICQDHSQR